MWDDGSEGIISENGMLVMNEGIILNWMIITNEIIIGYGKMIMKG